MSTHELATAFNANKRTRAALDDRLERKIELFDVGLNLENLSLLVVGGIAGITKIELQMTASNLDKLKSTGLEIEINIHKDHWIKFNGRDFFENDVDDFLKCNKRPSAFEWQLLASHIELEDQLNSLRDFNFEILARVEFPLLHTDLEDNFKPINFLDKLHWAHKWGEILNSNISNWIDYHADKGLFSAKAEFYDAKDFYELDVISEFSILGIDNAYERTPMIAWFAELLGYACTIRNGYIIYDYKAMQSDFFSEKPSIDDPENQEVLNVSEIVFSW